MRLKKKYSDNVCEILKLMLRYEEHERPSFTELGKLVLTSAGNTMESPSKGLLPKNIDAS